MKEYAKAFYKSKAWKDCRDRYAKSRGGLCEECLRRGVYKPGEAVHHVVHITPENIHDPAITLNPDNLRLLCRDCHAAKHKGEPTRYRVDKNTGRVITT